MGTQSPPISFLLCKHFSKKETPPTIGQNSEVTVVTYMACPAPRLCFRTDPLMCETHRMVTIVNEQLMAHIRQSDLLKTRTTPCHSMKPHLGPDIMVCFKNNRLTCRALRKKATIQSTMPVAPLLSPESIQYDLPSSILHPFESYKKAPEMLRSSRCKGLNDVLLRWPAYRLYCLQFLLIVALSQFI
jgi:hypothetical protein